MRQGLSRFNDRPFFWAALFSLLWHFFWFFSVTITVGPSEWARRTKTRSVALGPVLDDEIFKTLVENRPQVSEAFYRHMSDFEPPMPSAPEAPAIERHAPGDVVSVPFGKKFIARLKEFMDGDKPSPDFAAGSFIAFESLEGEVRNRPLLSRPPRPDFSEEQRSTLGGSEVLLEFTVGASGQVTDARVLVSSGDPAADRLWEEYLEGWRFTAGPEEKGRTRLRAR